MATKGGPHTTTIKTKHTVITVYLHGMPTDISKATVLFVSGRKNHLHTHNYEIQNVDYVFFNHCNKSNSTIYILTHPYIVWQLYKHDKNKFL